MIEDFLAGIVKSAVYLSRATFRARTKFEVFRFSSEFFGLWAKIVAWFYQNCNLHVQGHILSETIFLEIFGKFTFRILKKKNSVGLSKLHSTSLEKHFELMGLNFENFLVRGRKWQITGKRTYGGNDFSSLKKLPRATIRLIQRPIYVEIQKAIPGCVCRQCYFLPSNLCILLPFLKWIDYCIQILEFSSTFYYPMPTFWNNFSTQKQLPSTEWEIEYFKVRLSIIS